MRSKSYSLKNKSKFLTYLDHLLQETRIGSAITNKHHLETSIFRANSYSVSKDSLRKKTLPDPEKTYSSQTTEK